MSEKISLDSSASLESHRMVNIWLLPYRNMAVSGFGIKTLNYI